MAYGDNPDINYVPGDVRPIAVPRMTETERAAKYAQDLENRERIQRGVEESNDALQNRRYNDELANVARASRQKRADAVQARIDAGDPAAQARRQEKTGDTTFGTAFTALGRRTATTVPNASYGPRKAYTDTMSGTGAQYQRDKRGKPVMGADGRPIQIAPARQGLVEQVPELQQNVDTAALDSQRVVAEGFEDMADRQLQAMTQLRANQRAQADREAAQLARVQQVNDLAIDAHQKLEQVQDVDPGRYWRNAPAWQKFTAAIAAGLLGWAGRTDATAHITNAIAMDIDAQKAAIAKASASVGHLQNQGQREDSLYQQIRDQTSSVLEADLTYTAALLGHAKSQMEAKLQRAGITELSAAQQLSFNKLEQQLAHVNKQLGLEAMANTPTRTVVRSPYTSGQQGLLTYAAKKGIDESAAGRAAGTEAAGSRQEQEGRLALEAAKSSGKNDAEKRLEVTSAYRLAQDTATDQGVIDQANDFEKKYGNDVPGFGATGIMGRMKVTDAQQAAYYDLVNLITRSLRPETGAAYTAQEIDNASGGVINEDMPREDAAALSRAVGMLQGADEADVQHIVSEIKLKHRRRVEHLQRPLQESGILEKAGLRGEVAPRATEAVGVPDVFQEYGDQ